MASEKWELSIAMNPKGPGVRATRAFVNDDTFAPIPQPGDPHPVFPQLKAITARPYVERRYRRWWEFWKPERFEIVHPDILAVDYVFECE